MLSLQRLETSKGIMKKFFASIRITVSSALMGLMTLGAAKALAGTPQQVGYWASSVTNLGTANMSNDVTQTVRQLKAIRIYDAQPNGTNTWTASVVRVSTVVDSNSTNKWLTTNVLGSVVSAGGASVATYYETNAAAFLFYSDWTRIAGAGTGSFKFVQTHEVLP